MSYRIENPYPENPVQGILRDSLGLVKPVPFDLNSRFCRLPEALAVANAIHGKSMLAELGDEGGSVQAGVTVTLVAPDHGMGEFIPASGEKRAPWIIKGFITYTSGDQRRVMTPFLEYAALRLDPNTRKTFLVTGGIAQLL